MKNLKFRQTAIEKGSLAGPIETITTGTSFDHCYIFFLLLNEMVYHLTSTCVSFAQFLRFIFHPCSSILTRAIFCSYNLWHFFALPSDGISFNIIFFSLFRMCDRSYDILLILIYAPFKYPRYYANHTNAFLIYHSEMIEFKQFSAPNKNCETDWMIFMYISMSWRFFSSCRCCCSNFWLDLLFACACSA